MREGRGVITILRKREGLGLYYNKGKGGRGMVSRHIGCVLGACRDITHCLKLMTVNMSEREEQERVKKNVRLNLPPPPHPPISALSLLYIHCIPLIHK